LRHGADSPGETEHRSHGEIDLARHDHQQHPDREHSGHCHLLQQVRQIDWMEEQSVRVDRADRHPLEVQPDEDEREHHRVRAEQ
jgi:hypothetical protein